MPRGVFITFEGPEGGGKSTQAVRLADRLRAAGHEVLATREPGGTKAGEAIRHLLQHDGVGESLVPEAELLLFAASRAQLVRDVIIPALAAGTIVVSDRFADSTTAYQGFGRERDVEPILALNAFVIAEAVPDLTLLLDVPAKFGFDRVADRYAGARSHDRFEREGLDFHERVRAGYLQLARRWPDRFRILDACRPIDDVAQAVWGEVVRLLGERGLGGA